MRAYYHRGVYSFQLDRNTGEAQVLQRGGKLEAKLVVLPDREENGKNVVLNYNTGRDMKVKFKRNAQQISVEISHTILNGILRHGRYSQKLGGRDCVTIVDGFSTI